MTGPVLNVADAKDFPNRPQGQGLEKFGSVMAPMGKAIGAEKLGAMYMQVEPGKRAFPYHCHHGNEEMFVILEGEGTYRYGGAEYPLRAGDVGAAPAGGPETAHQIINTGTETLRYLSLSTKYDPDIAEYPDSGKFAAMAIGPGGDFMNARLKYIGRQDSAVGYFEGEDE
ncbi:MAG: cupin domain-containing protein [Paracoccaceae bacterium]